MNFFKKNGAGLLLCLLIAIPSWLLGKAVPVVGGPVFSILIGMIVTLILTDKTVFSPGINFTSKKILQTAVVFLGFGMNLTEILAKGKQSLPIILSTITTSLVIAFIMYKILHINSNSAVLVGVGSSICGGSAIAATAPVIGADDEEIAQSISVIFLFNVIAALVFPSLGAALGLTNEGFGLFAGTAINDTSSVTAAATAWDGIHASNTLEAAAIVKMTRTLAIIPITLVLAIYKSRKSKNTEGSSFSLKRAFPMFVLFFVLASVVTTIFHLPAGVTAPLKELSKFLIIMAMSAIGLNTNIVQARQDRNETYSHRILLLDRHCFCQSYDAAHSRYLVEFHCQTGFKKCHFLFWRIILCGSESDTFLFLICSASIIFLPGSYQYLPASHSVQKYLLPSQVPPESDKTERYGYCCHEDLFRKGT